MTWLRHLRRPGRVPVALAVLSYLPMLLTAPGRVSADTKSYLTLDPARLLSRAVSMWDPSVGAGTVTHQNIGFLFPLGPYYWAMDRIGVPDWITQRLLWGTLIFAAAMGVWRLMRWIGWTAGPAAVAAMAYAWSPYVLSYLARLSVILAPWAALPWLILCAARAVRTPGWRYPARFALIVAVVGSTNATSLLLVLIGPALWVLVDLVNREVAWRRVVVAGLQTASLCTVVSIWWVVGLRLQGAYGLPILRYTETYQTVATAATPTELMRGLGYWFFYGGDRLDQWVGPSRPYITNVAVIAIGFAFAGVALVGLFTTFWARRHVAALLVVGLAVSAGAAPWPGSSPYGWLFRRFTDTTSGMAMRSTPRALPLVILALAIGFGAAVRRLASLRIPRTQRVVGPWAVGAALILVAAQAWPIVALKATTPSLLRDETLPGYEAELAAWLDASGTSRVLEVPGADFANYRWGGTVDPALAGLIERPYLARELVPQGGPGTADLLNALDRRWQEGWFEPASLAPIAALFGVGTVVARNDLEYERYRLARPGMLDVDLRAALGPPAFTGPMVGDAPRIPMIDASTYGRPDAVAAYPTVAGYDLNPDEPLLRVADQPEVIVVGSGDGLVDAAAAGLLDASRVYRYAASDQRALSALRSPGTWVIITDTNRRQGRRWSGVGSNLGALERPDQEASGDPTDNRLDLFPVSNAGTNSNTETVLVHTGDLASVDASGYGNRITYTAEDAAMYAVDGDVDTAWRGAVFEPSVGLRIAVRLKASISADHLTLVQPQRGVRDRYITSARLTLLRDGEVVDERDVGLDDTSRDRAGQRVAIPGDVPFDTVAVEVLTDNFGELASYAGMPGVGLAEIVIPGATLGSTVQMPTAVLGSGQALADRRVTLLMTRQRIDPGTPNRFDPEARLVRSFEVTAAVTVNLTGTARLDGWIAEEQLSAFLGGGEVRAEADRRTPGAPVVGGWAAVDGNPTTRWLTGFDDALGATLTVTTRRPQGGQPWRLQAATGDDVSQITALSVQLASGRWVPLPAADTDGLVRLPRGVGATFAVRIDAVDPRTTTEYFNGTTQQLPAGIVDFVPMAAGGTGARPSGLGVCRSDLLTLDGRPLAVRLAGTPADAAARRPLTVQPCAGPLRLTAGGHVLAGASGLVSGIDIDRLVLDTGAPAAPETPVNAGAPLVIRSVETDEIRALVPATDAARWLVLRQSLNDGWTASLDGVDLGRPSLVDGYANGWLLPPGADNRELVLQWTPQRSVLVGLLMSVFGGLLALVLAVAGPRRTEGEWRVRTRLDWPWLAVFVVAAALLGGWAAGLGALGGVVVRRDRRWIGLVGLLLAGGTGAAWVVVQQFGHEFPTGAAWPDHFRVVSPLVWFAVGLATGHAWSSDAGPRHGPQGPDGPQPLHPIGTTPRVVLRLDAAHRQRRRRRSP